MTLKEWYIKNFKRDKAVIIYFVRKDRRVTQHWCELFSDNTVKVGNTGHATVIDLESAKLTTKWNIPTFWVHHTNCEAMDLEEKTPVQPKYTSSELDLIIDNDEVEKLYRASKKSALSNEGLIIIGAIVLGFLAMFYFFNTKLNAIDNKIPDPTPIVETVEEG